MQGNTVRLPIDVFENEQIAEQTSTEQDPIKLSELVNEVDRLLQEKQDRLKARNPLTE